MPHVSVDAAVLARVVDGLSGRWTRAAVDIDTYLAVQVVDDSHQEVVGPLLPASGGSGVVRIGDRVPTSVDAQSFRERTETHGTPPGDGWAYNDVRMNLLAYALTVLFRRSLQDVLRDRVMLPLGASNRWSWHGYRTSTTVTDGQALPVVSGGAHWGGGLFIPAHDLALLGQLFLDSGMSSGSRLLSAGWIEQSWTPCPVKPEYGYLWWLNDDGIPWPGAPSTGRSARGNGGRHLLWVDPTRNLVLTSHWTEEPLELIRAVSTTVKPGQR